MAGEEGVGLRRGEECWDRQGVNGPGRRGVGSGRGNEVGGVGVHAGEEVLGQVRGCWVTEGGAGKSGKWVLAQQAQGRAQ
jgi:hypothetical protein